MWIYVRSRDVDADGIGVIELWHVEGFQITFLV